MIKVVILCSLLLGISGVGAYFFFQQQEKAKIEANKIAEQNDVLEKLKEEAAELSREKSRALSERNDLMSKARQLEFNKNEAFATEQKLRPVLNYIETLEDGITHYENEIKQWKPAHHLSLTNAVKSFSKADGTSYDNAVIKAIENESITIEHNGSEITIPFADLSIEIREALVDESLIRSSLVH